MYVYAKNSYLVKSIFGPSPFLQRVSCKKGLVKIALYLQAFMITNDLVSNLSTKTNSLLLPVTDRTGDRNHRISNSESKLEIFSHY